MSNWTDELKERAVAMYVEAGPTAENSTELLKEIAEAMEQTPNGVRMVLTKAGVYVKKDGSTSTGTAKATEKATGKTRVSKEDSIADLKATLEKAGFTPDEAITDKLTGKAAVYFNGILATLIKQG